MKFEHDFNRRQVLGGLAGLALSALPAAAASSDQMPRRTLGKTGEQVSCIGLGGSHIGKPKVSEDEAIRLIRQALDRGLNFMDNAWDYNNGESEIRMGKALEGGYRQKAFLMTKFDGRMKQAAAQQIDESLKRLKTDHLDLLMFHETIRYDDPDRFFAPDGAMEALTAARQAGKTRYIGFTGHKDPHIHLYMLELARKHDFHFDVVLFPINVMDAHYRSFLHNVAPVAEQMGVAVISMKPIGSGVILKSNTVTAPECLTFALNSPSRVVITGIDSQQILDQAFHVAATFKPLTDQQVATLLAKTKQAAANGEYELFKTTSWFDSTAHHPEWLGPPTPEVKQLAAT